MSAPDRGEVWLIDLGYAAKIRPCLVLSIPVEDQDRALATVVAHTTSPRGSRFEAASQVAFLKRGVFDAQNLVTISLAKLVRRLGLLPADQIDRVESAVCFWLGLRS
jgi:mRNA interferase MazF